MSIKYFEEQIVSKLKWNKIEDIPDFPLNSFLDVKQNIEADRFTVGIDFTTSNELAQWLYGKGHEIFFLILASGPFIIAIASVVLTILLSNYWLLTGIVLGFFGQFMSNPYNPTKNIWRSIVGMLFLVFLYGLWQGKETITYLSAFFVFPFLANSYTYSMNQNKLIEVALDSEKIFIYLYQIGKLGLRHNENNKSYWYREAILEEAKRYTRNEKSIEG